MRITGRLDVDGARYVFHRLVLQLHGWIVNGLDTARRFLWHEDSQSQGHVIRFPGGAFGLPEFASTAPVETYVSVLE